MIFMQELIKIYLYPRSSHPFHFGPSTKSCERISVQSSTCNIHHPFHPPVRSTVQHLKLLITMFSSITFSLLHSHICGCKRMSTEVISLYNLNLIFMLFNVLCLCDTLYFKGDEGKIKRNSIHR